MISMKHQIASKLNGYPNAAPRPVHQGRPQQAQLVECTVPDTAPTAETTAITFDQRRARSRHVAFRVRYSSASAR